MKKFLMMAAMAVISLSASAQAWVGGSLSYTVMGVEGEKLHSCEVKPEIGYAVSNKFALGMKLGYKSFDEEQKGLKDYERRTQQFMDVMNIEANIEMNNNIVDTYVYDVFIINPFFRYNFYTKGLLTFYVDGGFCYTTKVKKIFVGINPGVKYDLTSKWSVSAEIGKIGWTHYVNDYKNHRGDFKFGGDLCLGLQYNF